MSNIDPEIHKAAIKRNMRVYNSLVDAQLKFHHDWRQQEIKRLDREIVSMSKQLYVSGIEIKQL